MNKIIVSTHKDTTTYENVVGLQYYNHFNRVTITQLIDSERVITEVNQVTFIISRH